MDSKLGRSTNISYATAFVYLSANDKSRPKILTVPTAFSAIAYVIPLPLFVNQECYIPNCLSRQAVFENSSCDFFRPLFKVKAKGQRSTFRITFFIIHDLW